MFYMAWTKSNFLIWFKHQPQAVGWCQSLEKMNSVILWWAAIKINTYCMQRKIKDIIATDWKERNSLNKNIIVVCLVYQYFQGKCSDFHHWLSSTSAVSNHTRWPYFNCKETFQGTCTVKIKSLELYFLRIPRNGTLPINISQDVVFCQKESQELIIC